MTEFWERFAFYGIRWALVLYIVAQFYGGSAHRRGLGEPDLRRLPGAGLRRRDLRRLRRRQGARLPALDPARRGDHGGRPVHDRDAEPEIFKLGLATIIAGNGLFKPNISTMVGKLYSPTDERRDSGFTIFYMGINLGAMVAPILTGWLAEQGVRHADAMPAYKVVFIAAGVGMLISLVWFWFGRAQLAGHRPPAGSRRRRQAQGAVRAGRRAARDPADLLPAVDRGDHAAVVRAVPDVRPAVRHDHDRGHQGRPGAARPRHRDADHLRLQHPVLDVLRAGRQLLHLPRREDRRQERHAASPSRWPGSSR